jgi:hypothetical protein
MRHSSSVLFGSVLVLALPWLAFACGSDPAPASPGPDAGSDDATTLGDAPGADATPPPADGGADADAGHDAGPPKPPFDWVGIVGTGQSLSVGATASSLSVTQPFHNLKLKDDGPAPKYPIDDAGAPKWSTTPLVEPIRAGLGGTGPGYDDGQYPNNILAETPHSGMANALTALFTARGGTPEYVTAHSVVGWSGHCLSDIDKAGGKRAYPASLHEASVFTQLAKAAGKTFGYGGIILTHGECDGGNTAYGAGLFTLWQNYNADLKAVTGQTRDVVLLVSQQSTVGAGDYGNSAVQVWRAGVDHPGQIVCTGPKYQYVYSSDNLHFQAPGYLRLGEKYAEVFDLVVNQGVAWKPLQPNKIQRAGAVLTIDFDVPNPPLAWDEHITAPHQTVNPEWAKGRGFEVKDSGGARLAIADVQIQGSSVVLTLAAAPTGKISVAYAVTEDGSGIQGGTDQGMRGQLRDSDEFAGYDAETIEAQLTMGSATATAGTAGAFARRAGHDVVTAAAGLAAGTIVQSIAGDTLTLSSPWTGATGKATLAFHHDQHNYCVHFAEDVP